MRILSPTTTTIILISLSLSLSLSLSSAQDTTTVISYHCDETQVLGITLPTPVPENGLLVVNTALSGTFASAQLTPTSLVFSQNQSVGNFTLSLGDGSGSLTLSFSLSGASQLLYSFEWQDVIFNIECPKDDPATPTWWALNSPWIVPCLIAISCATVLVILWWRRRSIAKAAALSATAMRRAVAHVVRMSTALDNIEMGDEESGGGSVTTSTGGAKPSNINSQHNQFTLFDRNGTALTLADIALGKNGVWQDKLQGAEFRDEFGNIVPDYSTNGGGIFGGGGGGGGGGEDLTNSSKKKRSWRSNRSSPSPSKTQPDNNTTTSSPTANPTHSNASSSPPLAPLATSSSQTNSMSASVNSSPTEPHQQQQQQQQHTRVLLEALNACVTD